MLARRRSFEALEPLREGLQALAQFGLIISVRSSDATKRCAMAPLGTAANPIPTSDA